MISFVQNELVIIPKSQKGFSDINLIDFLRSTFIAIIIFIAENIVKKLIYIDNVDIYNVNNIQYNKQTGRLINQFFYLVFYGKPSTRYWLYCDGSLKGYRKPIHVVGHGSVL